MKISAICFVTFIAKVMLQDEFPQYLLLESRVNAIVSNFLSEYDDYDVIVHFDSVTQHVYPFVAYLHSLQAMLLLNYDKNSIFDRPLGSKFVNVVFLTNSGDFLRFSRVVFNFEYNDVVLILSKNTTGEDPFWLEEGLDRAGSVFVLDLQTGALLHECFYCGNLTGSLREISTNKTRKYLNGFSNFYGQHFRIGCMIYMPYFWYKKTSRGYKVGGPEGKLLEMMSQYLNFSYSLKNFEGQQKEWKAMVLAIHNRSLDWAIGGISSSTKRGSLADLTRFIHIETFTVMFCCCTFRLGWGDSWKQIVFPFGFWVWIFIFAMQALMTVALKLFSNPFRDEASLSISRYCEITLRGLVDQPGQIPARFLSKRFLLVVWWCFGIITATSYRTKLASTLIHPFYKQPHSIKELLHRGYRFQVNKEDWSVLKENFKSSVDPAFGEVLRRSNNDLDLCSSIRRTAEAKVAVIDEETALQHEITTNCSKFLKAKDLSRLRLVSEGVFPSYHVWPLQLAAPYRRKFSTIIEHLHGNGILSRWYDLASKRRLHLSTHYEREPADSLPISAMRGPLLLLFAGSSVALLFFMCELGYFNYRRSCF